jgi:hypothetical protein
MSMPTENETWIIETGHTVIQKEANEGTDSLSPVERLILCLWTADYGMRNAGDLNAAREVYANFQAEAAQVAGELGLETTHHVFALPTAQLERSFLARFEEMCDEIRQYLTRTEACDRSLGQ